MFVKCRSKRKRASFDRRVCAQPMRLLMLFMATFRAPALPDFAIASLYRAGVTHGVAESASIHPLAQAARSAAKAGRFDAFATARST